MGDTGMSSARIMSYKSLKGGHYEMPKSTNILSHLTNDRAIKDYKYEDARKLVRQQEELLRNLAKVRLEMEAEETEIGKTKDYYAGSRKNKFGHTLGRAERMRGKWEQEMEQERAVLEADTDDDTYTIEAEEWRNYDGNNFQSEIQRLKGQVSQIANRYKYETTGDCDAPRPHYESPEYYPGASYVKHMNPSANEEIDNNDFSVQASRKPPKYLSAEGNIYRLVSMTK